MAKRGNPNWKTVRTPEMEAKIVEIIAAGNFRGTAAAAVGIDKATLCRWIKQLPEFRARVEAAETQAETNAVAAICADDDWKARAWFLERKFPERWGQTQQAGIKELYKEKLRAEIKLLEQRAKDGAGDDRAPLVPGTPEHDAMLLREWGFERTGSATAKVTDGEPGPSSDH